MPTFHYTALSATGQKEQGLFAAASRHDVLNELQNRSLIPLQLHELKKQRILLRRSSGGSLIQVYSGLADLLESGVPLLRSLEIIANQTRDSRLHQALSEIRQQVADGESFATALRSQPHAFDDLTINMITVGEEAGFLEQSLHRISQLTQRRAELRSKIIGALVYPSFLLAMGIIVSSGMFLFFVPIFEPLFERMSERGELPWITTAIIFASSQARTLCVPSAWMLLVLVLILRSWFSSNKSKATLDRIQLKAPGIGPIITDLMLSRFADLLGSLLGNGVSMIRALELTEKAMGNSQLNKVIGDAKSHVQGGGSLADIFSNSQIIPAEFSETLGIAEQSNRLDSVLPPLAVRLESRAQKKLDILTKMLEPILMTFLATAIGFLIIALLLPIFTTSGNF